MKMSPTERANEAEGIERFGIYLSYMRKRPGMYFGAPPFLMPFHNFLLGYDIAENCHDVSERHFSLEGFREWLIANKGLKESNLGWPGMIEQFEPDDNRQLEIAIDWFSEFAKIPLLDESTI